MPAQILSSIERLRTLMAGKRRGWRWRLIVSCTNRTGCFFRLLRLWGYHCLRTSVDQVDIRPSLFGVMQVDIFPIQLHNGSVNDRKYVSTVRPWECGGTWSYKRAIRVMTEALMRVWGARVPSAKLATSNRRAALRA